MGPAVSGRHLLPVHPPPHGYLPLPRPPAVQALRQVVAPALAEAKGVGCDVQLTADLNLANDTFVQRNFTDAEIAYCRAQPDPQCACPPFMPGLPGLVVFSVFRSDLRAGGGASTAQLGAADGTKLLSPSPEG